MVLKRYLPPPTPHTHTQKDGGGGGGDVRVKVAIVIAGDDTFVCFFCLPQWLSLLLPALPALRAHLSCIVFTLASRSNEDQTSMTDGARNVATDLSQHDGVTLSASSRHSPLLTTPQSPPPLSPQPSHLPHPLPLQPRFPRYYRVFSWPLSRSVTVPGNWYRQAAGLTFRTL